MPTKPRRKPLKPKPPKAPKLWGIYYVPRGGTRREWYYTWAPKGRIMAGYSNKKDADELARTLSEKSSVECYVAPLN